MAICAAFQSPDERGGYCDKNQCTLYCLGLCWFQSPDERGGYCDFDVGTVKECAVHSVSIP